MIIPFVKSQHVQHKKALEVYQEIRAVREKVKHNFIARFIVGLLLPKKCLLGGK